MGTERPRVLTGKTIKKKTGCGNLYVTVNRNGTGVYEVFASLGKNGGCTRCMNEALTRAITLGLKYGVPVEEFVNELSGLRCPNPCMWPEEERTLSCPDAVARVLKDESA